MSFLPVNNNHQGKFRPKIISLIKLISLADWRSKDSDKTWSCTLLSIWQIRWALRKKYYQGNLRLIIAWALLLRFALAPPLFAIKNGIVFSPSKFVPVIQTRQFVTVGRPLINGTKNIIYINLISDSLFSPALCLDMISVRSHAIAQIRTIGINFLLLG